MDPRLRELVARSPVARLATVRPGGRPHVVPITFALDGDTIVTAIDHKPKSTTELQRLRNLAANPDASVLVDHYQDDWSRLWWVRADGVARIVRDDPERSRMLGPLRDKYAPYRDTPPAGPVVAITVTSWSTWTG